MTKSHNYKMGLQPLSSRRTMSETTKEAREDTRASSSSKKKLLLTHVSLLKTNVNLNQKGKTKKKPTFWPSGSLPQNLTPISFLNSPPYFAALIPSYNLPLF